MFSLDTTDPSSSRKDSTQVDGSLSYRFLDFAPQSQPEKASEGSSPFASFRRLNTDRFENLSEGQTRVRGVADEEICNSLMDTRAVCGRALSEVMRAQVKIGFLTEHKSVSAESVLMTFRDLLPKLVASGLERESLAGIRDVIDSIEDHGWDKHIREGDLALYRNLLLNARVSVSALREECSAATPEEKLNSNPNASQKAKLLAELQGSLAKYSGDISPFLRTLESVYENIEKSNEAVKGIKRTNVGFSFPKDDNEKVDTDSLLQQLELYSLICEQVYERCSEDRFSVKQVRVAAQNVGTAIDAARAQILSQCPSQQISFSAKRSVLGALETILETVENSGSILHHILGRSLSGPERAA